MPRFYKGPIYFLVYDKEKGFLKKSPRLIYIFYIFIYYKYLILLYIIFPSWFESKKIIIKPQTNQTQTPRFSFTSG